MLFINYKGNIPQQRFYSLGVINNNKANKVRFILAKKQADLNLTDYLCTLKVENKEVGFTDLIELELVDETTTELTFEWVMSNKDTQFRNLDLQLEFLGGEDIVWQTLIVSLELSETIRVGDKRPTEKELSILKQMAKQVHDLDIEVDEMSMRFMPVFKPNEFVKDVYEYWQEHHEELGTSIDFTFMIMQNEDCDCAVVNCEFNGGHIYFYGCSLIQHPFVFYLDGEYEDIKEMSVANIVVNAEQYNLVRADDIDAYATVLYKHHVLFDDGDSVFEFIDNSPTPITASTKWNVLGERLESAVRFIKWYNDNGLAVYILNPCVARFSQSVSIFGFANDDPTYISGGGDDSENFNNNDTLPNFVSDTVTKL